MSLALALERFPLEAQLRDHTKVVVRPVREADSGAMLKFFAAVPEVERLFIECPIRKKELFENWCKTIDLEHNFKLLMFEKRKMIGWINMHIPQAGWMRHIGRLRLLTHPDYHGRNVSKILVQEIITAAKNMGVLKLEAELTGERKRAIRSLHCLGFEDLCRLPDYVIDTTEQAHDYLLMGMEIKPDEEFATPC